MASEAGGSKCHSLAESARTSEPATDILDKKGDGRVQSAVCVQMAHSKSRVDKGV